MTDPSFQPRALRSRRAAVAALTGMAMLGGYVSAVAQVGDQDAPSEALTLSGETDAAFQSYTRYVAAAEASFRRGDVSAARESLRDAPHAYRGWEWYHLQARLNESRDVIRIQSGPITALALSPDGRTVATGGADGVIRLVNITSGAERAALTGHTDAVDTVQFNPRGDRLVSGSRDGTGRVWDLTHQKSLFLLNTDGNSVTAAAFSPDGQRIAACANARGTGGAHSSAQGQVYLWDATAARPASHLTGGVTPFNSMAFFSGGSQVFAGSKDGSIFEWNVNDDVRSATLHIALPHSAAPVSAVNSIDVSPDGSLLACGSANHTVGVWNLRSHQWVAMLRDHHGPVHAVAFSPDGRLLATAGHDNVVRLWDVSDWNLRARLYDHRAAVRGLAWLRRGNRLFSAGLDGTIRVWDSSYRGYEATIRMEHNAACHAVCFNPSGDRLFSCGSSGSVNVWDADVGRRVAFWDLHPGASCIKIDMARDGRYFASCATDNTVRVWDTDTSKETARLRFAQGVQDVAMSPDSQAVAVAQGNTVSIWNVRTRVRERRFVGHEAPVAAVAYSADGSLVASVSSDGTARIWHVATGLPLVTMNGNERPLTAVALDQTGTLLATGDDKGTVKLWAARTGTLRRSIPIGDGTIHRLAFSPDGTRLAVGTDQLVLCDVPRGAVLVKFQPYKDGVWDVQFSRSGKRLASCAQDGAITIMDSESYRERMGLPIRVKHNHE